MTESPDLDADAYAVTKQAYAIGYTAAILCPDMSFEEVIDHQGVETYLIQVASETALTLDDLAPHVEMGHDMGRGL